MKNKLQKVIKEQIGQVGIILLFGLGMFVAGVICLLIWGINMDNNGGWFLPGLILAAGGFVLLVLGMRSGGD
jgi:hypothetical protein